MPPEHPNKPENQRTELNIQLRPFLFEKKNLLGVFVAFHLVFLRCFAGFLPQQGEKRETTMKTPEKEM